MNAKLPKLIRRTRTAARTIAQALVSAVRGRTFRLIADLYRAIDGRQAVRIGYVKSSGERSERDIEPRDLIVTGAGNITLRAYDHRDAEDTTFRVDRITHHALTAEGALVDHPLLPLIPVDQRPEPLRRIVAVGTGLVIVSAPTTQDGEYEVTSWRPRTTWEIASERNELGGQPAAAAYVSARIIHNPDDIPFAVQEAAEHLERWLAQHQVAA